MLDKVNRFSSVKTNFEREQLVSFHCILKLGNVDKLKWKIIQSEKQKNCEFSVQLNFPKCIKAKAE